MEKCRECETPLIPSTYQGSRFNGRAIIEGVTCAATFKDDNFIDTPYCFECGPWVSRITKLESQQPDDPNPILITPAYSCYRIGPESARHKGHYGMLFEISRPNQDPIRTTNLWHNGTAPMRFWSRLTANCRIEIP